MIILFKDNKNCVFLCGELDGGVPLFICDCFSWKPVADYIDQQFEQYFRDESGLNRKNIQDNRVHCCLYFISPFGHGYDTVVLLPSSSLFHFYFLHFATLRQSFANAGSTLGHGHAEERGRRCNTVDLVIKTKTNFPSTST